MKNTIYSARNDSRLRHFFLYIALGLTCMNTEPVNRTDLDLGIDASSEYESLIESTLYLGDDVEAQAGRPAQGTHDDATQLRGRMASLQGPGVRSRFDGDRDELDRFIANLERTADLARQALADIDSSDRSDGQILERSFEMDELRANQSVPSLLPSSYSSAHRGTSSSFINRLERTIGRSSVWRYFAWIGAAFIIQYGLIFAIGNWPGGVQNPLVQLFGGLPGVTFFAADSLSRTVVREIFPRPSLLLLLIHSLWMIALLPALYYISVFTQNYDAYGEGYSFPLRFESDFIFFANYYLVVTDILAIINMFGSYFYMHIEHAREQKKHDEDHDE